jgi:hypothetical protein
LYDQVLVQLRQLSPDSNDMIWPEDLLEVVQRSEEPVGRLKENGHMTNAPEFSEPLGSVVRPSRRESQKGKALGAKP